MRSCWQRAPRSSSPRSFPTPLPSTDACGDDAAVACFQELLRRPTVCDLHDPDNPALAASDGYCGDGGIPGYVLAWLVPNDDTVRRLPAALAHETNHNVRFQFVAWRDDITLGEMMVSEGLAENFAVSLYGEENAGPWVTKTSADVLENTVKPAIRAALDVQGMAGLSAYLYGDDIAAAQGYPTAGLPYCAGYACGYHLVRCYLDATGADIAEATLLPAEVILQKAEEAGFWG